MKNIITLLTLTISSILLSACGGGGTTATDSGSSLTFVNADGNKDIIINNTALKTGISTKCFSYTNSATTGRINTLKIVDADYTWTTKIYSNDTNCTTTPTTGTATATLVVRPNSKISSWDTVPNKSSDNSTPLPSDASYTVIYATVTSVTSPDLGTVGTTYPGGYIIDDSSSKLVIYNLYQGVGQIDQPYVQ